MSRFVADDGDFVAPDADLPLVTASRLLRHLGVAVAPHDVQERAVQAWLKTNRPDALLRRSLAAAALMEMNDDFGAPDRTEEVESRSSWLGVVADALRTAGQALIPESAPLIVAARPALVGVRAADAPPPTEGVLALSHEAAAGIGPDVETKWAIRSGSMRIWLSRLPAGVHELAIVAIGGDGVAVASKVEPVAAGRAALSVPWLDPVPPEVVALVVT